ncbi:MAG: hypothetical protein NC253_15415 [Ruminococcus sp.]|nr:hypothetical protein [Ruminococcus sp.]MCM1382049.1 hypothetical protein [Muribaculaceae bacterium]MCM1480534.1 hypothetical protein [Muribaculaceae bacterium]
MNTNRKGLRLLGTWLIMGGAGSLMAGIKAADTPVGKLFILPGIVLIIGGLFALRGITAGINKLKTEGWCIEADFDSATRPKYSSKASRQRLNEWPYTIECSWTDPAGAYHIFTDVITLRFDPTRELYSRKKLTVYVDKENPKKYYIDLEFLKEIDKRNR